MAEYAGFVYSAYVSAAIVLVAVLVHAIQQRRTRRSELAALQIDASDDRRPPQP